MSMASVQTKTSDPSVAELVARAREVGALARKNAKKTETDNVVPVEVVDAMHQADLFRILQPKMYGGFEYGFDALVPVVAAVSAGCGSAGWIFSLGIVHHWIAAKFPKQAQDEIWAKPRTIGGGSYPPTGKAVAVPGGYRLSGRWAFTSGCDHMEWLLLGGMIPPEREGAAPTPAFFLVDSKHVAYENDWFTMGLGGTGSKTTVGEDLFVPSHRVLPFGDLLTGVTPGAQIHRNPLYLQSMLSCHPFALVSPILGMAEGALEDFVDMARVRATRGAVAGGNNRMAEFATVQTRVAEAKGCIEAARLMIYDALGRAQRAAEVGQQADPDLRIQNRMTQAFCVKLLVQGVDALFLASGGQSIYLNKPIQRMWRDAHAGATHIALNWDAASTMYGQHALGLEPRGQY